MVLDNDCLTGSKLPVNMYVDVIFEGGGGGLRGTGPLTFCFRNALALLIETYNEKFVP